MLAGRAPWALQIQAARAVFTALRDVVARMKPVEVEASRTAHQGIWPGALSDIPPPPQIISTALAAQDEQARVVWPSPSSPKRTLLCSMS